MTGATSSVDFPVQNPLQPVHPGGQDAFVTKPMVQKPELVSLVYVEPSQLPPNTFELNRFGDLSSDNPDGTGGTEIYDEPAFLGGWRIFPDAKDFDSRATSRNRVRIRATISVPRAGIPVYFRSFDVDDPAPYDGNNVDETRRGVIDSNDVGEVSTGSDNHGKFTSDPALLMPADSANAAYQGRLRPLGETLFQAESFVVKVLTNAQGVAEVDLATTFAPGDNFRVVASLNEQEVKALNNTTSVPTKDANSAIPLNNPNFTGKATAQLAVWRRFHIEQDRMAPIPFISPTAGWREGTITEVVPFHAIGSENPTPGEFLVATNILNLSLHKFNGASLIAGNSADPHSAGRRYLILRHFEGAFGEIFHIYVHDGPPPANGPVRVIQGDYQWGNITASSGVTGGRVTVTTDIAIPELDKYELGILRIGGINYEIVSNTGSPTAQNCTVTVTGLGGTPLTAPLPTGQVELFEDDFKANGNAYPTAIVDPNSDANLYDMLMGNTFRFHNRYADAYLQPDQGALNQFDSVNSDLWSLLPPTPHLSGRNEDLRALADHLRGTRAGFPPRPAQFETDVFWAVYVATAYESNFFNDGDGAGNIPVTGGTDDQQKHISLIYLETIRDAYPTNSVAEADLRARVTVHEIGHQFRIAVGPNVSGEHRTPPPGIARDIMFVSAKFVPTNEFYLHPQDINWLRLMRQSPGSQT